MGRVIQPQTAPERDKFPAQDWLPAVLTEVKDDTNTFNGKNEPALRWVFKVTNPETGEELEFSRKTSQKWYYPKPGANPSNLYVLVGGLDGKLPTEERINAGLDLDDYIGRPFEVMLTEPNEAGWQNVEKTRPQKTGKVTAAKPQDKPADQPAGDGKTVKDRMDFDDFIEVTTMWDKMDTPQATRETMMNSTTLTPEQVVKKVKAGYAAFQAME